MFCCYPYFTHRPLKSLRAGEKTSKPKKTRQSGSTNKERTDSSSGGSRASSNQGPHCPSQAKSGETASRGPARGRSDDSHVTTSLPPEKEGGRSRSKSSTKPQRLSNLKVERVREAWKLLDSLVDSIKEVSSVKLLNWLRYFKPLYIRIVGRRTSRFSLHARRKTFSKGQQSMLCQPLLLFLVLLR